MEHAVTPRLLYTTLSLCPKVPSFIYTWQQGLITLDSTPATELRLMTCKRCCLASLLMLASL